MTETTALVPSGKTPVGIRIENLLEKTGSQLEMLCETLNQVQRIASEPRGVAEGYEHPEELRKKAADSAIRILHQIDNIVEDMPRWGNQASQLEKHYTAMIRASAEAQDAVAFKAQMDSLPHARVNVHLHQSEEGRWGAYLVQNGGATLMGSGSSPQLALNDFDLNFIDGEKVTKKSKKKARQTKKTLPSKVDGPTSDQSPSVD
jgi:hypothetical protein